MASQSYEMVSNLAEKSEGVTSESVKADVCSVKIGWKELLITQRYVVERRGRQTTS
ncbi:MAG: hypothetical protein AB1728_08655 [Bacteroidota bacterium]